MTLYSRQWKKTTASLWRISKTLTGAQKLSHKFSFPKKLQTSLKISHLELQLPFQSVLTKNTLNVVTYQYLCSNLINMISQVPCVNFKFAARRLFHNKKRWLDCKVNARILRIISTRLGRLGFVIMTTCNPLIRIHFSHCNNLIHSMP